LSDFKENLDFQEMFRGNPEITNFMKIGLVEAELLHASGQTDNDANSRVLQFCERAHKIQ